VASSGPYPARLSRPARAVEILDPDFTQSIVLACGTGADAEKIPAACSFSSLSLFQCQVLRKLRW
jgi:hypothetical protein